MAGLRDVLPGMAAILMAQWSLTNPTQALTDCRIMGRNDPIAPQYNTVGWTPRTDGVPFCIIVPMESDGKVQETQRTWATYKVELFVAVAHATTSISENYNDQATAWIDAAWYMTAANRRLGTTGALISPVAGDVRWEMRGGIILKDHPIMGVAFYGAVIYTNLMLTLLTPFQA